MSALNLEKYLALFKKELTDNLLSFWMGRCLDRENGGYFNCFTNDGSRLISKDKYIWSQGRFLWMFSRLSIMESDLFDERERAEFLKYAESGKDFLLDHVLMGKDDYRCVFLTDASGNPKTVEGHEGYDLSISADCFVVMGFSAYARAAKDAEAWRFAKALGESVWERYQSDKYRSLPYPVPVGYRTHAKPMILTNMCCEMYRAAEMHDPAYTESLRANIEVCHREVFEVFADERGLIHEFRYADGSEPDELFVRHINPGHSLEDMWFQWEAAEILGLDRYKDTIVSVAKATMERGWDPEYGGFYHFVPCDGFDVPYKIGEKAGEDNPQLRLVLDDFGSKLWWVHSEAVYTSLLMYAETGKEEFLDWFERIVSYTFETFPNPDRSVGEWIQIRTREGKPQDKVVALPVKDPYHIIRNILLCIELLEKMKGSNHES
ncbi:MAG: AGE family epimerase/isomerase [Clostridia bacterium]|nr:AGE family epimerase/isomerase [Clostridia bacterium]